jgi:hypothetical protein
LSVRPLEPAVFSRPRRGSHSSQVEAYQFESPSVVQEAYVGVVATGKVELEVESLEPKVFEERVSRILPGARKLSRRVSN